MKRLSYMLPIIFIIFSCTNDRNNQNIKNEIKKPNITEISLDKKVIHTVDKSYLLGKFDPSIHKDFIMIENTYTDKSNIYLRKDVYNAFKKMCDAAAKDNISFKIISATRNFNSQKSIWESKWSGKRKVEGKNLAEEINDYKERALKILEFSSMPGSSRHHWGTDIDINNLTNSYFENGKGLKEYNWLVKNANKFGFCQPYIEFGENRKTGYQKEKWHWSYFPVSISLINQYKEKIKVSDIKGFLGSESASEVDIINNYVMGINKSCLFDR